MSQTCLLGWKFSGNGVFSENRWFWVTKNLWFFHGQKLKNNFSNYQKSSLQSLLGKIFCEKFWDIFEKIFRFLQLYNFLLFSLFSHSFSVLVILVRFALRLFLGMSLWAMRDEPWLANHECDQWIKYGQGQDQSRDYRRWSFFRF